MKTLTILMAGIIIIYSCSNSTKGTSVSNNSDSTVKWTKLITGNQCSVETPLNSVITSQEQLDAIWNKAFAIDMPPEKPRVDFTKNSVMALFLGMINKGGHSIEITSISKEFQVTAEHKLPGKNCMTTMAIEFPYYFALTNVVKSGKAEFVINNKEVACE